MIKKILKKVKKSDFLKHTAILTSGTAIAQLIAIFSAPITYRIYQPDDYGTLGLFMTASSLISVFSTLQYHNAIITAEKDADAISVTFLSIYLSIIFSIITFFFIIIFKNGISKVFGNKDLIKWLIFLPLSACFTGLNLIFSALATRKKKFKLLSSNRIIAAVIVPIVSILIGISFKGPVGLMAGLLVGQVLPTILLIRHFSHNSDFTLKHSLQELIAVSKVYRNFPFYSLPASWINNFSNQLPVFLLNSIGGSRVVGLFNLSNRILGLPSQLISTAIGEIFIQRATKDYFQNGTCRKIFLNVLMILAIVGFFPFLLVAFVGPELFSFAFGKKWIEAGEFSQIFSILFFFKFVVSPLTYTTYISSKQWIGLLTDILLLSTVLIIMWLAKFYNIHYKTTLIIYSLAYSSLYFVSLWVSFKLTNNPNYVAKN